MGFIREQFGRITVESRRESFMIHVEDASLREPSSEWWTDDLDDLIAALVDYRASLGRVSGGGSGVDTPPPNPYRHDDEYGWQRVAWDEGFNSCKEWLAVRNPSNPYRGLDDEYDHAAEALTWDEGFAAGLAARDIPDGER